jgi:hypothetical protein
MNERDHDYHRQVEEALKEGSMLLQLHHPTNHGVSTEGDLPECLLIDNMIGQLNEALGPLVLLFVSTGDSVDGAQHKAMQSLLRSALEIGFATGRVFQSHGYDVPVK